MVQRLHIVVYAICGFELLVAEFWFVETIIPLFLVSLFPTFQPLVTPIAVPVAIPAIKSVQQGVFRVVPIQ